MRVVSPVGTPAQNGAALIAAYGALTPPVGERGLVLVESGVYDVGAAPLALRANLDLRGVGSSTVIKAASGVPVMTTANLGATDVARVEDLTLVGAGPGTYLLTVDGAGTLALADVAGSGPLGIYITSGFLDVDRSILNVGNYAIDQGGGTATVRGSQLISTTTAWYSSPGVLRIAGSRIVGVTAGSCTGSSNYDGNYAPRVGC